MAELQNFRSAFNGFNREDVVHYIEYLNNKHNGEVGQLKNQVLELQAELEAMRAKPSREEELADQLKQEQERSAALQAEADELRRQLSEAKAKPQTEEELEAYRRAERAERVANDRVSRMYEQANGALADAAVQVEASADQISELADSVVGQLAQLQSAIISGKATMKNASASLYAVKPIPTEE